jgi:pilus assembly protein CpaB
MNKRLMTILFSAFVVAAICSFLVYRAVGSRLSAARGPATTRIVAASSDIKIGTVLAANQLTTIEIAGGVPKGAILKPEAAIGRGVVSNLYAGEAIMDDRLAPMGSGGGLAATIKDGMRACAVKVDDVVGVAGFVTAGERVDVLISGVPPGPNAPTNGPQVKTLLQNIEVLSAGTDIQKDSEGKPKSVQVVNLLVTPDQAESLSLASNQTKIQLVLRNPLDTTITKTEGTDTANLFGGAAPVKVHTVSATKVVHRAAPEDFSIQIYNGSKRSDAKFASSGGTK